MSHTYSATYIGTTFRHYSLDCASLEPGEQRLWRVPLRRVVSVLLPASTIVSGLPWMHDKRVEPESALRGALYADARFEVQGTAQTQETTTCIT